MKKIIVTLWACAIFAIGAIAQTVDLQFAPTELKQVGPSPQAAAMTRYADAPVSYSLGLAQVSIPLYEIKSRSLTLPLSLSYNSSGVRVDEVSGPAGLNWNLEAGGVITRTVIGLPDETAAPGRAPPNLGRCSTRITITSNLYPKEMRTASGTCTLTVSVIIAAPSI